MILRLGSLSTNKPSLLRIISFKCNIAYSQNRFQNRSQNNRHEGENKSDENISSADKEADPLNLRLMSKNTFRHETNEDANTQRKDSDVSHNENNLRSQVLDNLLLDVESYAQSNEKGDANTDSESKASDLDKNRNRLDDNIEGGHDKRSGKGKDELGQLLASLNLQNDDDVQDEVLSFDIDPSSLKQKSESNAEEYRAVNVDRSDENVFDLNALDLSKQIQIDKKTVEEEKQLFKDVFQTYSAPQTEAGRNKILLSLKDAVDATSTSVRHALDDKQETSKIKDISADLKQKLFAKVKDALLPTLEYIRNSPDLSSSSLLVSYLKDSILRVWIGNMEIAKNDKNFFEDMYLSQFLAMLPSSEEKRNSFIKDIFTSSQKTPSVPMLNVLTLPVLFNEIIHKIAMRYYDCQLALSLFNLLKRDINLYTVFCNQQTYNEILRLQWLYYGKNNLYGIEMTFVEMLNNGFTGDIETFNLLKQVIIDYYNLKMGKSFNRSRLPIWTKEDDKRAENLERKLALLVDNLNS